MNSKNNRFFILSILLIFSISNVLAGTFENNLLAATKNPVGASLTTGKSGYVKGETVVIRGSGFRSFEAVTIKVGQFDNSLRQEILRGEWTVYADRKGNFVSNWEVPLNGTFTIKGVGSKSGFEVQTVVAASVAPVVVSGNPSCATLNASSDPAFGHILSDWGFKIDPPASGTFTFENAAGRILTGGAPSDSGNTLTVSNLTSTTFDWSATRSIKAVIVKGGPNAHVYPYNPFAFSDTNLTTVGPGSFGISHLEFCFDNSVVTAARVSVSGRVTDEFGNGVPRTILTVFNTSNSETRTAISNQFGYYRFDELEVGNFYIVTAFNKRYSFENDTQTLMLNDAVEGLDFKAFAQ